MFYLTCWLPVTRYQFMQHQLNLLAILRGFHESDLQHAQMERAIIEEVKKLAEKTFGRIDEDKNKSKYDKMFG